MKGPLTATALLIILFCAGCVTPPLKTVPVATISNKATLVYSYNDGRLYRIESFPTVITVLKPQASSEEAASAAGRTATDVAAKIESNLAQSCAGNELATSTRAESSAASTVQQQAEGSIIVAQQGHSEVRLTNESAFVTGSNMAGYSKQISVGEQHAAADVHASQKDTSVVSTVSHRFAASSVTELVEKSSMSATNFASVEDVETHHSSLGGSIAHATTTSLNTNASARWSMQLPTIRKWSTRDRVIVGERFEYVVEVCNPTGINLAVVGIGDRLDSRLIVNANNVHVISSTKSTVDLTNGLLKVRFPQGLNRGTSVRIVIPVVLTSEIEK
jgi:hypothetical protein